MVFMIIKKTKKIFVMVVLATLVSLLIAGCNRYDSSDSETQTDSENTVQESAEPESTEQESAELENTEAERNEPSTGTLEFTLIGEDGNNAAYDIENVVPLEDTVLTGKTIFWLGSSVTSGLGSENCSMADYMAVRNNMNCVKEAVPSTTLATHGSLSDQSFVTRMLENLDPNTDIDAFICQISTNDANEKNWPNLGEMPTNYDTTDLTSFNLEITLDSVQYIIEYVHETWDCPIYFYSGSYFGDEDSGVRGKANKSGTHYSELVSDVIEIASHWDEKEGYRVGVIDLYNDTDFNNSVSDSDYTYLMVDPVHPYKAGYLVWWTPYFEEFLTNEFQNMNAN